MAAALTFTAHLIWEEVQGRLFAPAGLMLFGHLLVCLIASLGDVLIAAFAYWLTAAVFRRPDWPLSRDWVWPALLWLAAGLAITVVIERIAVTSGLWAYGPSMPTAWGVGLMPLAQWVVVPSVTLLLFRLLFARGQ